MLFFIRGAHYEKRLDKQFVRIKFINRMCLFMKDHWGRIRSLYAVTPRFTALGNNLSSRIMFFLLEFYAHLLGLLTKVKYEFSAIELELEERLERPLFNIKANTTSEQELQYYTDVMQRSRGSYNAYQKKLKLAEQAVSRIDENVEKLHRDFDSKSSMVLQTLIFFISVIFVLWGVYELWLDKILKELQEPAEASFLLFFQKVSIGMATLVGLYFLASRFVFAAASFSFDTYAKKLISRWLCDSRTPPADATGHAEPKTPCGEISRKYLKNIVEVNLKSRTYFPDATEVALQYCALGMIGVELGQVDEKTVEEGLDEVSDDLRTKKSADQWLIKRIWVRHRENRKWLKARRKHKIT